MKRQLVAALGASILVLAACGSDKEGVGTEAPATTPATTPDTTADTVPVTDPAGTTPATDPADVPTKIVSLSPTGTEMLFAIGAGDQIIAIDDQSNFPAEALDKPHDLSGFEPNVEAIAALEPDLVVIGDDFNDLTGQLGALGITVWSGPSATTFDDIYTQIEQLGATTGHIAEAAEVVSQIQTGIDAAIASAPKFDSPISYYHELSPDFYSATSNTFIGKVYGLFGMQNIADTAEAGNDYPQLSAEFIISQDPALIFLADGKCCQQDPTTVAARDGWGDIAAVKSDGVVAIDDDIASRWGPRIVDYVQAIADTLNKLPVAPV